MFAAQYIMFLPHGQQSKSRLVTLKSKVSPLSILYFCVKKANFLEQMFEKKIMAKNATFL